MKVNIVLLIFMSSILICTAQESLNEMKLYGNRADSLFDYNLEEALLDYEQATNIAYDLSKWDSYIEYKNMIYVCLFELKQIIKAEKVITDLYNFCKQKDLHQPYNYSYNQMYNNLGVINLVKHNYDSAIKFLLEAIKNSPHDVGEIIEDFSLMYFNLSEAYRKRGDYDLAIKTIDDFFTSATKRYGGVEQNFVIKANIRKSNFFIDKGDFKEAKLILKLVIADILNNDDLEYERELYSINKSLATVNLKEKEFIEGIKHINFCVEYLEKDESIKTSNAYILKSRILLELGRPVEALKAAFKGLNYYKVNYTDSDKIKSRIYNCVAKAYHKLEERDSSKYYFDKSFSLLSIPNTENSEFENHIKNSDFNLNNFYLVSDYALDKLDQYKQSGDIKLLVESEKAYDKLVYGSIVLSKLFRERGSKINLFSEIAPIYNQYISVLLLLIEKHDLKKYYPKLFEAVESNKSRLLGEKKDLNQFLNKVAFGSRESIISLEREIAFLEKYIYQEKNKKENHDAGEILIWENNISSLKDSLNMLSRKLEAEYPAFYSRRLNQERELISQLQDRLTMKDRYLSYYQFGNQLLLLSVENNKADHKVIKNYNSIRDQVDSLLSIVTKTPTSKSYQEEFHHFQELASGLYTQLLGSDTSPSGKSNLIISPHSWLQKIPFELLLTASNLEAESYKQLNYLIRMFSISYVYTDEQVNQATNDRTYDSSLFIAPSFSGGFEQKSRDCNSEIFGNLECAKEECEVLAELFEGELVVGDQAKTNSLVPETSYKILHFATHACLDSEQPLFNRIHFTDDYLSLTEINNLNISADLVTLSACNTASGIIETGEGVYNLAKGFILSGANSVISSLWSVNDCSTKDLMTNFYTSLKESGQKSESLRLAKLNYLDQATQLTAHPYFWSGFILVGDSLTIPNSDLGYHKYLFYAFMIICVLMLISYFKLGRN